MALAIGSPRAHAQSDCQDTFAAELTRLRGASAAADERYRTTFSADGGTLHATIRAADGSTRALSAGGPDCRALASATAVAVALLLDASPPEPGPQPAAPAERAQPPRRAEPWHLAAGVGAGLLLGIPRDLAPTVLGELALGRGRWRGALGVLWAPAQRESFAPGEVRSTLAAGDARVCLTLLPHLALCSGAYLGRHDMRARGYTRNEHRRAFWGAAPVELAIGYVWAHVGTELGLGALLPFQRRSFTIDGLGTAQTDWPIQALFALRVFGLTNL